MELVFRIAMALRVVLRISVWRRGAMLLCNEKRVWKVRLEWGFEGRYLLSELLGWYMCFMLSGWTQNSETLSIAYTVLGGQRWDVELVIHI